MSCSARCAFVFKTASYIQNLQQKNKCLVAPGVLWYLKQLLYSKFAKKSNASPKSKCYCPLYENIGDKVCPLLTLHLLWPR